MYLKIQSFEEDYRMELTSTQKLLDTLTDESLTQEVAPGYRTLGQLAWHLVPYSDSGILAMTGLEYEGPAKTSHLPQTAAAIAEAYRTTSASIIEAVQNQWTDEKLLDSLNLFGQQWKYGGALDMFIKHEIHHRGQLTILMRQAGLPVTGVYGPSKEEWTQPTPSI
jgi:uncharacterized damage-inducible protein DinB